MMEELILEFNVFCESNGLPQESAYDLLNNPRIKLTLEQEEYLKQFIIRWDSAQSYDFFEENEDEME